MLLSRIKSMARWIFRRAEAESQLSAELATFVEMSAAEKIKDGMAPDEARRQALAELGGIESVKEQVRERRHGGAFDEVFRDVRYALRMLVRYPAFSAVVVLTLALGIGANTSIFSLIDALMFRPLAVARPQELAQINLTERGQVGQAGGESFSYAIVRGLSEQRDIFSGVAGFSSIALNYGPAGSIERLLGGVVTGGFFDTFGLRPATGRLLTPEDDRPGAPLVAVISDAFWARAFNRRPDIVGSTIVLNGQPVTIVGVMPPGFSGADATAAHPVLLPVAAVPRVRTSNGSLYLEPGVFWLRVLARPRTGLTAAEAEARLNARWASIADDVISPKWSPERHRAMRESVFWFASGATGWTGLRETYRRPLLVLMAGVGLVLLIACANVAGLLVARAASREREIAVRLAIGASRGRVVRQLLVEGVVLSLCGAAIGVVLAGAASRTLARVLTAGDLNLDISFAPNLHVLAFAAMVGVVTGGLFGLAPALRITAGAALPLQIGSRGATARTPLLSTLVVAQVALSLVLIAGAGLFVRTFQNLRRVSPGFDVSGVMVSSLEAMPAAPERLLDELRAVPGVAQASFATQTPLDGSGWTEAVVPAGQPLPETENSHLMAVGPGFFDVLGTRLTGGRAFSDDDRVGRPGVAIVNAAFAKMMFPDERAIGRRVSTRLVGTAVELEIVGTVADSNIAGLRQAAPPILYVPFAQFTADIGRSLIVRLSSAGPAAIDGVRRAIQAALPNENVDLHPLDEQVAGTIVRERLMAALASAFALLALLLSCLGLYGLLSYGVSRRAKEIGIRMALGAEGRRVVGLVLRSGAVLVAAGVAIGLPASWFASRFIGSMLFGLAPRDPATAAAAVAALAVAAGLAAYVPARRASKLDPLIVLRRD